MAVRSEAPRAPEEARREARPVLLEEPDGYGSKFNHQGTTGFSPRFHLQRVPFRVAIFDPQTDVFVETFQAAMPNP